MHVTKHLVNCRKPHFKDDDPKYSDSQSFRTHCGLCCVCHTIPTHSRTYYGHLFCNHCFHKYIWTPSKHECSGDVEKVSVANCDK